MNRKLLISALILTLALVFYLLKFAGQKGQPRAHEVVSNIVDSEKFLESQRTPLKNFAKAIQQGFTPAAKLPEIFAEDFQANTIVSKGTEEPLLITAGKLTTWLVDEKMKDWTSGKDWSPLKPLFQETQQFDFVKAYMIRGKFINKDQFEAKVGMQGRTRTAEGNHWRAFKSKQTVVWNLGDTPQISSWKIDSFELLESPFSVFEDVTDVVIPDQKFLKEVKQSMHEEYFIDGMMDRPVSLYHTQAHLAKYLDRDALTIHPGLAVVDYDNDGWDDLYLTVRQGRNLLLKNQSDGTFRDATIEAGLAVPGFSNAALFADFDNDGDADLFLGRVLTPSLYFRNDGGVFTECSNEKFNTPLPSLANSVSAVDYNQDGLLDIYVCTYGMFGKSDQEILEKNKPFLTPEAYAEYKRKLPDSQRFLDMVGPPNVLYVNRGEKGFEIAPENSALEFHRNSFQSSWADYDDDGDVDLYIANDFAPDVLIRNDGPGEDGSIRFTDVTQSIGHPAMRGFGMGADWGDYDRDGKVDLYVSNMYSKAGLRITEQVPDLDSRFHEFAEGNRLYRYDGEKFELTSIPAKDGHKVNLAGWSWGGVFFDADNDGWLDIYAANGYYSSPPELTNEADG